MEAPYDAHSEHMKGFWQLHLHFFRKKQDQRGEAVCLRSRSQVKENWSQKPDLTRYPFSLHLLLPSPPTGSRQPLWAFMLQSLLSLKMRCCFLSLAIIKSSAQLIKTKLCLLISVLNVMNGSLFFPISS